MVVLTTMINMLLNNIEKKGVEDFGYVVFPSIIAIPSHVIEVSLIKYLRLYTTNIKRVNY